MSRIVVTGFASLDHIAILDGVPSPGVTTTILDRPADGWPRLGGSPAYVAAALVADDVRDVAPISWIGPDDAGAEYRRQLGIRGVDDGGIETVPDTRTPITILGYEPSGGCICLYDPGMAHDPVLSAEQRGMIASAEWVCVTIGPAAVTEALLEAIGPSTRLAWVVKHDPRALPLALAARLAGRADVICFSRAESGFVHEALDAAGGRRPDCYMIETQGRAGAACTLEGRTHSETAEPVQVVDPTGAGDTFAGGVLAALVGGERDPSRIVKAGQAAARRLLMARQATENESI